MDEALTAIRAALTCGRPGCPCRSPNGLVHCPAHDDEHPSLSLELRGGRLLWKCFAGCSQEAVAAALKARGWDGSIGGRVKAEGGLCLADLAAAKRLPESFLRSLGLRDVRLPTGPAVAIPYLDTRGQEVALRYRLSLNGDIRFRWRKGASVLPYGLQRLGDARKAGWVLMVEGESDAWTSWFHGLPAIGLPGKTVWRSEWAAYLL